MRRVTPAVLLALGVLGLLGWYVSYTQRVVVGLRREAANSGQMYARVYQALGDTSEEVANAALLELSRRIREIGVPVIVTDRRGNPTAAANLPFDAPLDDPRVRAYVRELDRENPAITEPGIGTVHFGHTPLVRGLRVIPIVQAALIAIALGVGLSLLRTRARAEREALWAGMARESAHQLATPLSSLSGWLELLHERDGDPLTARAMAHMREDLERLERVAHRFERIGRPPRQDEVDLHSVAERIAEYFRARVPTLAHPVQIAVERAAEPALVRGDPVLLEWAVESLVRNAVDALAGRGGRIDLRVAKDSDGRVRLAVADDGPGIPLALRRRVFEAGFTTKPSGWGIGLPLARRIAEENHAASLALIPSTVGTVFEISFRPTTS